MKVWRRNRYREYQWIVWGFDRRGTGQILPTLLQFFPERNLLMSHLFVRIKTIIGGEMMGLSASAVWETGGHWANLDSGDGKSRRLGDDKEKGLHHVDYSVNLCDIMQETRATSLHYELNRLRLQNAKLAEEIQFLTLIKK